MAIAALLVACGGPQHVTHPEGEAEGEAEADAGPVRVPDPVPDPVPVTEQDAGTAPTESADSGPPPSGEDAAVEVASADAGSAEDPAHAALIARGRRAYDRVCETCHEDGPRLIGRHLSASRVRRQVREGGSRMRPIPAARLSDADLSAVCAFLSAP
jgi:cytochrome c5